MSCSKACSRRKSELEESGRNFVSFHCDSKGNYEKLQCDVEKGLCWCAESLTGTPTTPFVPLVAVKKLFCCMSNIFCSHQFINQLIFQIPKKMLEVNI